MASTVIARAIGACFGIVFVMVNASALPEPWSWVARGLGIAALVGVLLRLRAPGETVLEPRPSAVRIYWASVLLEALALVVGARLLAAAGHGEYGVAWVALVVGVHFLPFGWAFRHPAFGRLGIGLILLAAGGAAVGLLGGGEAGIALVAGVGSGFALLLFAALPVARNAKITAPRSGARQPCRGR